jgi:leucyl aminopeptidase
MQYNGAPRGTQPRAIVGKGIMYDTGGYNLKTGKSMADMKYDMCGAAAVLGAMQALAARKAPVNVVGVMACAMNMVGQNPFVADSIYKSYKGLHVEIGNTDAEGRLVLADAIAYTIDKFQPEQLVDLATLTGAVLVALAGGYAGLFSTSNPLANALIKAGDDTGERLWRMPVDDFYGAKTKVADVNNDGSPYGGSALAAVFLKKFVDGKAAWAHLDIAGTAWVDGAVPGTPAELGHATGYGVRLLTNWLENAAPITPEGKPARRRGRPPRVATAAPAATRTAKARKPAAPGAKRGRGRPRKTA